MRRDAPLGAVLRLRLCANPTAPFLPAGFTAPPIRSRLPLTALTTITTTTTATTPRHYIPPASPKPSPAAANPPSTTRPPPLALPTRDLSTSTVSHLFSTGKAYLIFYKTGLRQILTNHRLCRRADDENAPPQGSRAAVLLAARSTHDVARLPIFALLLLVCGEFTPLAVLAVPSIVPYTCRIPKQVDKLLRDAEGRRATARDEFHWKVGEDNNAGAATGLAVAGAEGYLARVLGVVSPFWDRIGVTLPPGVVRSRVRRRLEFLRRDDELLVQAGGVPALEADEVRLACEDRGIAVREAAEKDQRALLEWWLELVRDPRLSKEERDSRMAKLLLTEPAAWPHV